MNMKRVFVCFFVQTNSFLVCQTEFSVMLADTVLLSIDDNKKLEFFTDLWTERREFISVNVFSEKINKHDMQRDMICVNLYFCKNVCFI